MSSSLQGFVFEKNLNSRRSRMQNQSLGKSFYSLSFNFQKKFGFTHFQSINQKVNQIYLFIITFQNLEFWDVTETSDSNREVFYYVGAWTIPARHGRSVRPCMWPDSSRHAWIGYRLHIVQAVLYMAVVVVRNLKKGFLSSRKIRYHVLRITVRVKQRQLSWASHWAHMHEDYYRRTPFLRVYL